MRFSLLRLTFAAIMITSLVGCSATRERFAKAWPWGKKKYDTEQALANAAPYPSMPSEAATPGTPGTGYGTPYANTTTGANLASTAGAATAPAYQTASTAGIYPPAGYTNPAASTTPNYSGTYGTTAAPAYGAPPTANPYTQQSYAPAAGGTTGYTPPASTAQTTAPPSYGAPQSYGASPTTPSMNSGQMPATQYGAGSYSYGTPAGASAPVANTAAAPTNGTYSSAGYEATAATGPTDYAPATNGYQPGNLGYQPGNNGYQPAGVPTYQTPAAYQTPTVPYTSGTTGAEPYRPGGTGDYMPQSSTIPAGGSVSGGGVTPAGYDAAN